MPRTKRKSYETRKADQRERQRTRRINRGGSIKDQKRISVAEMMNNESGEENDDDVMNILQNVQVKMEDIGDGGFKDNSSNVCEEEEEEEEDDEEEEEESESEGKDEDSHHDSTNASTHEPFEQVFVKEEHDSNSMDELLMNELCTESGDDEADAETCSISDPLITEGIKIEERFDDFGRVEYQCIACDMRYLRRDVLIQHMTVDHKGLVYFCSICREIFSSNENLQLHINTHLNTKLACEICGLLLSTKRTLENHLAKHGIVSRKKVVKHYVCNICHEVFKDLNALSRHMFTHKSIMFSCKVCKFWCDSEVVFQKHLNKHPSDNQEQKTCVKCEKTFLTQNDLDFHKKSSNCWINEQRTGELVESNLPYKCDVCGNRFEANCNLQKHKSVHDSKMYSCKICGKVYNYNTAIVKHILQHNVDHTDILRFRRELSQEETMKYNVSLMKGKKSESDPTGNVVSCEICGKVYQYYMSLANHMRLLHGIQASHNLRRRRNLEPRVRKRRPFRCDLCGKRFSTNGGLMRHSHMHTSQTYPCKICGKVFYYSTNFFKHLRVHNMEPSDLHKSRRELPSVEDIVESNGESLKCDICGRKLKNKDKLLNHRRSHKPKSVSCKICGKSYNYKTALLKHLQIHDAN